MKENNLDEYIDMLDHLGQHFEKHFSKFLEIQDDVEKLQLGGEVDMELGAAMYAADEFSKIIKEIKKYRVPIFGGSDIKKRKKNVVEHSERNLNYMTKKLHTVDQPMRNAAWDMYILHLMKSEVKENR